MTKTALKERIMNNGNNIFDQAPVENKQDLSQNINNVNVEQKNVTIPDQNKNENLDNVPLVLDVLHKKMIKEFGPEWSREEKNYAFTLIQSIYIKAKNEKENKNKHGLWNAINNQRNAFLVCILRAMHLKLSVAAKDLFYIIPYKGIPEFQLGYQGIMELGYRAGLKKIIVREVYDCDEFHCEYGLNEILKHIPNFDERDDAKITKFYACITQASGLTNFEIMSTKQIDKHRDRYSKNLDSSDSRWKTDYPAMAMKTVLIKAMKWCRKSDKLSQELDDAIDAEFSTDETKLLTDKEAA